MTYRLTGADELLGPLFDCLGFPKGSEGGHGAEEAMAATSAGSAEEAAFIYFDTEGMPMITPNLPPKKTVSALLAIKCGFTENPRRKWRGKNEPEQVTAYLNTRCSFMGGLTESFIMAPTACVPCRGAQRRQKCSPVCGTGDKPPDSRGGLDRVMNGENSVRTITMVEGNRGHCNLSNTYRQNNGVPEMSMSSPQSHKKTKHMLPHGLQKCLVHSIQELLLEGLKGADGINIANQLTLT